MDNASARNLWGDFLDAHLEYAFVETPNVSHFSDNEKDANECLDLVLKNKKTLTSHSLLGFQLRNENLPKIGDFTILTDWEGAAKCIVKTTAVQLKPFFTIDDSYARMEGEGDLSLNFWKDSHFAYYKRELAPFNKSPKDSMIVVCEQFEKVFEKK